MENDRLRAFIDSIANHTPDEQNEAVMCKLLEDEGELTLAKLDASPVHPVEIKLHGIGASGWTIEDAITGWLNSAFLHALHRPAQLRSIHNVTPL